jgi:hypothetical protein
VPRGQCSLLLRVGLTEVLGSARDAGIKVLRNELH